VLQEKRGKNVQISSGPFAGGEWLKAKIPGFSGKFARGEHFSWRAKKEHS
jgi:hypothetical protein